MTSGNKSVIGGGTRFERHDPELVAKILEAKRRIAAGEGFRIEEKRHGQPHHAAGRR